MSLLPGVLIVLLLSAVSAETSKNKTETSSKSKKDTSDDLKTEETAQIVSLPVYETPYAVAASLPIVSSDSTLVNSYFQPASIPVNYATAAADPAVAHANAELTVDAVKRQIQKPQLAAYISSVPVFNSASAYRATGPAYSLQTANPHPAGTVNQVPHNYGHDTALLTSYRNYPRYSRTPTYMYTGPTSPTYRPSYVQAAVPQVVSHNPGYVQAVVPQAVAPSYGTAVVTSYFNVAGHRDHGNAVLGLAPSVYLADTNTAASTLFYKPVVIDQKQAVAAYAANQPDGGPAYVPIHFTQGY